MKIRRRVRLDKRIFWCILFIAAGKTRTFKVRPTIKKGGYENMKANMLKVLHRLGVDALLLRLLIRLVEHFTKKRDALESAIARLLGVDE